MHFTEGVCANQYMHLRNFPLCKIDTVMYSYDRQPWCVNSYFHAVHTLVQSTFATLF